MFAAPSVAVLATGAALLVSTADAHSYMIDPMPTWPVSWATNNFAGLIEGNTYLPCPDGMSYSTDPLDNTEAYWTAFNASSYTSLKDLADQTMEMQTLSPFGTATKECGFSLANGTARDLPEYVEWNQLTEGHDGPCEVWCDDVLAFEDDNCAVNYPDDPAKLPYDITKCEGASMLTSYWIALHGLPWQVYINCAPLTGAVNSSDSSASTTTTTTTAPATTTAAPTTATTTTTAPAASASDDGASGEDEYEYDESDSGEASTANEASTSEDNASTATSAPAVTTAAPTATTSAPATTTAAPAATTAADKCNARARRRN